MAVALHSTLETVSPSFHRIDGASSLFPVLRKIFNEVLQPLYGSQEEALRKIALSQDRRCFVLIEGTIPVGVLVFKTVLSNEFSEFGIHDSIEIKSLFLVQSDQTSGRGLGSQLLNKLTAEATDLHLGHLFFHVTVSESRPESLTFFQKKGFEIHHKWAGKYVEHLTEYLLGCPSAKCPPHPWTDLALRVQSAKERQEKQAA